MKPAGAWAALALTFVIPACAQAADPTLAEVLGYPFISGLVTAQHADRIAWVQNIRGVRNIWVAEAPGFVARQVTRATADDGQELTGLTFSPDGARLVYVRGGAHDANWAAEGHLAPNPANSPDEPKVTIWTAPLAGGAPTKVAEGDFPALSAKGVLAYIDNDQVWTIALAGTAKPRRLLFDRGKDSELAWSPDGGRLAFVSNRGDHAFIGVYAGAAQPIVYMQPSTGQDDAPVWSPDGARIAFTRQPGAGGVPQPLLVQTPQPWSIWTADAATGAGQLAWRSPLTLDGSYPQAITGTNLNWAAGGKLVFTADLDGWRHLYALPAAGGAPALLTPGAFMVEDVALTPDRTGIVYSANTGGPQDQDRRHLFRVAVQGGPPVPVTSGLAMQTAPAALSAGRVAFIDWGAQRPARMELFTPGADPRALNDAAAPAYPSASLIVPKLVTFKAADGLTIEGQLFQREGGAAARPGIIFVHGGPPRQMLLGWHYMDYYSNAYAVNQYLAAHGFVVLAVNYRLGIAYGRGFQQPDHAGPAGAAEYLDVVAGAHFLQRVTGVDPARIGIWGGSYGGYLTALALARNSDLFKAGVDFHGVHDWSLALNQDAPPTKRYEQGDFAQAMQTAWASSPDAAIAAWRSPVLLIQGDDDRNVRFDQTVDLSRRLDAAGVRYEELVIPNEIHGFLRAASWAAADTATVEFLSRELRAR